MRFRILLTDLTTFAEPCPAENVTISGIDLTFEMTEAGTMANSTQFCPIGTSNCERIIHHIFDFLCNFILHEYRF